MKNKSLLVTLAAAMRGLIYSGGEKKKTDVQPGKKHGKSKGGGKRQGFLKGLPKVAAKQTPDYLENWHRQNKRTKPRKVK